MGENFRLAAEIAQIAARQHGNVSRGQLADIGLTDQAIGRRVAAGSLFRVFRGVYAVGRPPITPLERAAAAVLACGSRAALSHGSAMTLWGFWKRWDQPFEVTVAIDRRPRGVRVYRCSTLLRKDIDTREGITVTSAARTILDTAPRMRQKSLTRTINDARRANVLTLDDLADQATRQPTHPGTPLVRPHLDNPQNPTRSEGEDDFPGFCERYGLPAPLMNAVVYGIEVDAFFPVERVIVELDGWPYHRDRSTFESDRDRDATMLMYDLPTVRITYDRIDERPGREAARLNTILENRRAA